MLSLKQKLLKFLTNLLARVSKTERQKRIIELRADVLSSVGAQEIKKAGIRSLIRQTLSFTGKIFNWTCLQSVDQAETLPLPSGFNDLDRNSRAENRILIVEDEDVEYSPPTTPITKWQPLMENRPVETITWNFSAYVYRNLFQNV